MEFRVAPLILLICNFIFILGANPHVNTFIPLKELAQMQKVLIPFALITILSVGTFIRHTYYSKLFKMSYYLLQLINFCLMIYYVWVIKAEHL